MAIREPYPDVVGNPLYVVRLHDDKAAVLRRNHQSREYEACELTDETFGKVIERLHSEGYRVRCTCPSITPSSAPG